MQDRVVVVGGVSDDPFAIDVAHYIGQHSDISDLIAYKTFANTEFCPRFISDEADLTRIGKGLLGRTVIIMSTCSGEHTRNARAMRNFLVARAAKDNGAEQVVLVEPDLFYSAQDRGPLPAYGKVAFDRDIGDYKKFDGQAFSAKLYAQLLHTSGVDCVITVHNHSVSVEHVFDEEFGGRFLNLSPADLYAHYLSHHAAFPITGAKEGLVICAPDKGAAPFAREIYDSLMDDMQKRLIKSMPSLLLMSKVRTGERRVSIEASKGSPAGISEIQGKDVVVSDDMVRTGNTIVTCCKQLKEAGARRVIFVVTHFYSSDEVKENLNSSAIDEIITTNTLPNILNRDMQGRLRRKMLVLKIEKWIGNIIGRELLGEKHPRHVPPYSVDVSSKNPIRGHIPHELRS